MGRRWERWGTPRMGIWGHQEWFGVTGDGDIGVTRDGVTEFGVTRDGRETEDGDLGSPGMVWGHQV